MFQNGFFKKESKNKFQIKHVCVKLSQNYTFCDPCCRITHISRVVPTIFFSNTQERCVSLY
uniref:Uncharacterized protein n=1 Tax=Arundo donax TaxID=35708 RepID=A0A0A9ACV5_ARUDO